MSYIEFRIHTHEPWKDADDRAKAAGYQLTHIAGFLLKEFGNVGGPYGVFKDGALVARFTSHNDRNKWLHEKLMQHQP